MRLLYLIWRAFPYCSRRLVTALFIKTVLFQKRLFRVDGQNEITPLLLAIPGKCGYQWVKWVVRIELVTDDRKGHWAKLGLPDSGDIGDAWSDGHAGVKPEIAELCYQLGVNIIFYAHAEYNKWLERRKQKK